MIPKKKKKEKKLLKTFISAAMYISWLHLGR